MDFMVVSWKFKGFKIFTAKYQLVASYLRLQYGTKLLNGYEIFKFIRLLSNSKVFYSI